MSRHPTSFVWVGNFRDWDGEKSTSMPSNRVNRRAGSRFLPKPRSSLAVQLLLSTVVFLAAPARLWLLYRPGISSEETDHEPVLSCIDPSACCDRGHHACERAGERRGGEYH